MESPAPPPSSMPSPRSGSRPGQSGFNVLGVLGMCVLGGGLLAAAVLTGGPRQSNASPDEARAPIEPPKDVNWHPGAESEDRVLCELIGVQYRVLVLTGTDEPRYTVLSLEGDTLLERGTLSEVTAMFPTLDLAGMKDAEGHSCGPLMLMDLESR